MYSFDHVFPATKSNVTVALYGLLGRPSFSLLFSALVEHAQHGRLSFIIRHFSAQSKAHSSSIRLSGYGVELAVKSTEYKAVDDREVSEKGRYTIVEDKWESERREKV